MVYYKPGKYHYCEICGAGLIDSRIEYTAKKKKRVVMKQINIKQCPRCYVMYTEGALNISGILHIYVPTGMQKDEASSICQEAWNTFQGELSPNIYRSDIMKLIYIE